MTTGAFRAKETPREGRFLLAAALSLLGSLALEGAWLAPNHYPPWTSFHGEAAAFAAVLLFAAARAAWPQALVRTRAPWLAAAVLAVIALQWWAGQIPYDGDAFLSGMYVVGWTLAWWLGVTSAQLMIRPEPVVWLAWIIVIGAALAVAIALLQWLRMESVIGVFAADRGPEMRPYSNLGQPNHLASLVLMAVALALLLHTRRRLSTSGCVLLVLWFSWGLTLSESRAGLLSAFCMCALAVIKGRGVPGLPRFRWIAAWGALLGMLALSWPAVNEALYLQEPRGVLTARESGRLVIWKQCIAGIEASPWVGYGWRQSMAGQKAGAATVDGSQASDYAHSIVLDVFLWVGIPLGLVIGGAVLWWLARVFARLRGDTELLLFASILPLLVHSMFEFPFAYSYFLFPAAWILAVIARTQRIRLYAEAESPSGVAARLRVLTALVLFGASGAAVASEYMLAEEDYRVMRFEIRRVGRTPDGYAQPRLHVLTQLGEMLALGRITPKPGMPADQLARMREGSIRFGWPTLHLKYAMALAMNGQPQLAAHEMRLLQSSYGDVAYGQARQLWDGMLAEHSELAEVPLP
jgi:hypothetical protein